MVRDEIWGGVLGVNAVFGGRVEEVFLVIVFLVEKMLQYNPRVLSENDMSGGRHNLASFVSAPQSRLVPCGYC